MRIRRIGFVRLIIDINNISQFPCLFRSHPLCSVASAINRLATSGSTYIVRQQDVEWPREAQTQTETKGVSLPLSSRGHLHTNSIHYIATTIEGPNRGNQCICKLIWLQYLAPLVSLDIRGTISVCFSIWKYFCSWWYSVWTLLEIQ